MESEEESTLQKENKAISGKYVIGDSIFQSILGKEKEKTLQIF